MRTHLHIHAIPAGFSLYIADGDLRFAQRASAADGRVHDVLVGNVLANPGVQLTFKVDALFPRPNLLALEHLAGAVVTLIAALERSGKTLICTTGSGIVVDSADGEYAGSVVYAEDTYFEPVPFRRPRVAMNRLVREAAIDKGIRSVVICPPMIYGKGRGLQPDSDQLPKIIALSKQAGAGVYFGKGLNRYSNVHIDDLVELYLLALEKAPGGSFFFAENGHASFKEIAEMVSRSLGFGGKTVSLSVEDLVRQYGDAGRYGAASNSLVSAVNARRLGWSPKSPSLAEYFASLR